MEEWESEREDEKTGEAGLVLHSHHSNWNMVLAYFLQSMRSRIIKCMVWMGKYSYVNTNSWENEARLTEWSLVSVI